jgi:hypothetical protein
MFSAYKYIQAFSIDIALGGVIGALFVAKYLGIELDYLIIIELFLTIWLIYTFDHLIDSGSGRYELVAYRHKIHAKLSTTIWGVWSFALIVALSLLFKIPTATLMAGSILGVFVVMYFFSLKLLEEGNLYHKEFSAALLYAAGIFIGPFSVFKGTLSVDIWILFIEFALLAAVNLLVFSMYEQLANEKSGFQSLLKALGSDKIRIISWTLIVIVMLLSIGSIFWFGDNSQILKAQLIILIMAIFLLLVFINQGTLVRHERYRMIGDAIFFVPALFILS